MGTFVAVGDSFTVGVGDDPEAGGWIQRTATALTSKGRIHDFRNLAARNVLLDDVLQQQLPKVGGRPRIISAIAGANDILVRRCDVDDVIEKADRLIDWAMSRAEMAVLTCTCPDFFADRSARLRRLSARVDTLNRHVHRRQRDAPRRLLVVDAHGILSDPSLWADDGLHANPKGHARLAEAATTTVLDAERQLNGGTGPQPPPEMSPVR
jgi:lysophospholipase L1-like esterase